MHESVPHAGDLLWWVGGEWIVLGDLGIEGWKRNSFTHNTFGLKTVPMYDSYFCGAGRERTSLWELVVGGDKKQVSRTHSIIKNKAVPIYDAYNSEFIKDTSIRRPKSVSIRPCMWKGKKETVLQTNIFEGKLSLVQETYSGEAGGELILLGDLEIEWW